MAASRWLECLTGKSFLAPSRRRRRMEESITARYENLGLQETAFFDPQREAWGFGAHLALFRIDRETGTPTR